MTETWSETRIYIFQICEWTGKGCIGSQETDDLTLMAKKKKTKTTDGLAQAGYLT